MCVWNVIIIMKYVWSVIVGQVEVEIFCKFIDDKYAL